MNSITSLQIPLSWPDCPDIITRDQILEDPKQTKDLRTVENCKEIASYLMLRNKRYFGQAHGTMFTVPPLSNDIGWGTNYIALEL
eukprot:2106305-Ditylum_brightwellii.AAC.1